MRFYARSLITCMLYVLRHVLMGGYMIFNIAQKFKWKKKKITLKKPKTTIDDFVINEGCVWRLYSG